MTTLRIPPHNLDAEISVLGGILLNNQALAQVKPILSSECFYREAHAIIYQGMSEMTAEIDLITLTQHLKEKNLIEKAGGREYIVSLVEAVSTSAGIVAHAEIIRELYLRRQLLISCGNAHEKCYQEYEAFEDIKSNLKKEIISLEQTEHITLEENAKFYIKVYESIYHHGDPGLFPGIDCLNDKIYFEPGYIHAITSESGVGKSAFMLQVADNISTQYGPCLFYSLESTRQKLALRQIARYSHIALTRLNKGHFTGSDQEEKLMQAVTELAESRLVLIDDDRFLEIEKLVSHAESYILQNKVFAIFLDYLQLAQSNQTFPSDKRRIDNTIYHIKSLAKNLKLPVIYACQTRKDVGGRPTLDDLYESNVIRQATDNILFLWAPNSNPTEYEVEIFMGKGKEQQKFSQWLHFNGNFQQFTKGERPEEIEKKKRGVPF